MRQHSLMGLCLRRRFPFKARPLSPFPAPRLNLSSLLLRPLQPRLPSLRAKGGARQIRRRDPQQQLRKPPRRSPGHNSNSNSHRSRDQEQTSLLSSCRHLPTHYHHLLRSLLTSSRSSLDPQRQHISLLPTLHSHRRTAANCHCLVELRRL